MVEMHLLRRRSSRILALLTIGAVHKSIRAQDIITQISWPKASTGVMVAIIVVLAGALALSAAVYFRGKAREKEQKEQLSTRLFDEEVERLGLSAMEVTKIKELLRHEKTLQPQVILQSVSVFERCVDIEVQRLKARGADPTEMSDENMVIESLRRKTGFRHLPLEHPLVSTRNISIGQAGSIFGKNHRTPIIQRAVVTDTNEFSFVIQYNVDREDLFEITPGTEIKYAFARQNDGLYGVALNVLKSDGAGHIEVAHTVNLRRNQLREYVRMEANLPLKFRLLRTTDPDKSDIRRGQTVEAKMSDISGGGLSFLCDQTLRAGDLISVSFNLPTGPFNGVGCRILRVSLQEGKTTTHYKHHCKFENIEVRRRDAVVKYVFEKQRQANQWR